MGTITQNGVTTTQINGEENYTTFSPFHRPKQTFYQYDYRHVDGELFSYVKPTLEKCREARDNWLKNKK